MFLGYIGSLLFEGKLEELKEEIKKIPIVYEDVRIFKALLDAIASRDELSLFYKITKDEEEKAKRMKELVERLEESIKILEKTDRESDRILARRYKQIIELLGAAIAYYRFFRA